MGWFGPSAREVVAAIVSLASSDGITIDKIQDHEAWHRYASRWSKPRGEEVMKALKQLKCRGFVRERCDRKWEATL